MEYPKLTAFLDTSYERPTEDFFESHIVPALHASRALIVVLTPGAAAPLPDGGPSWVEREVEAFSRHAPDRPIIAVRAIGEPTSSIPAALHRDYPLLHETDLRGAGRLTSLYPPVAIRLADGVARIAATLWGIPTPLLPEVLQEARRTARRTLTRLIATAAVLLAVVTGPVVYVAVELHRARLRDQAEAARDRLRDQAEAASDRLRDQEIARTLNSTNRLAAAALLTELPEELAPRGAKQAVVSLLGETLPFASVDLVEGRNYLRPAFSGDGSRLAIASESEAIVLDARTGTELSRCSVSSPRDVRLDHTGRRLLTYEQDGAVRVTELDRGLGRELLRAEHLQTDFPEHEVSLRDAIFDASGLAYVPVGQPPAIWSLDSLERTLSIDPPAALVASGPGGFWIARRDRGALTFAVTDGRSPPAELALRSLRLSEELDHLSLSLAPSGEALTVALARRSDDGATGSATVYRWDSTDETWARVERVDFALESHNLAFVSLDSSVGVDPDLTAIVLARAIELDHPDGIDAAAFRLTRSRDGHHWRALTRVPWVLSRDGRSAAGTQYEMAWISDVSGRDIPALRGASGVTQLAFDQSGATLVTVHGGGEVRLWRVGAAPPSAWSRIAAPPRIEELGDEADDHRELPGSSEVAAGGFSSRVGGHVAGLAMRGVLVWELGSGREPLVLPPPPCNDFPEYLPPRITLEPRAIAVVASCQGDEAAFRAPLSWTELQRQLRTRTTVRPSEADRRLIAPSD